MKLDELEELARKKAELEELKITLRNLNETNAYVLSDWEESRSKRRKERVIFISGLLIHLFVFSPLLTGIFIYMHKMQGAL